MSLLSVIDSIKFHSSDYLDALEMGMKPQEGSQYWVYPIIVEYMNDRFDKKLLQYIQNNEGNGMQFVAEYYNQNKGLEDEIWIGQNLIIMENPLIMHLK